MLNQPVHAAITKDAVWSITGCSTGFGRELRTDRVGRSAHESKIPIADYAATAGMGRHGVRAISGQRAGDPVRAIRAIIDVVEGPEPPHHLLLGNAAYDGAIATVTAQRANFEAWEAVSRGADFPVEAAGRAA